MELHKLSKEAGVLRTLLKSGKIDLNQLESFLQRVEQLSSTPSKKGKVDRFDRQLTKLSKSEFPKRKA